jgi:hypothetical protein
MLADAPRGTRKRTTKLEAEVAIDRDGRITHLRFTRLSIWDSFNKAAFDSLNKLRYKPVVVNGERVSACSTVSINVDLNGNP